MVSFGKIVLFIVAMEAMFFIANGAGFDDYSTNPNGNLINQYMDVNKTMEIGNNTNAATGTTGINQNVTSGLTSGLTQLFPFSLFLQWGGLRTITNFVFAPAIYMQNVGAPSELTFMIGALIIVGFMVSLMGYIRGMDA